MDIAFSQNYMSVWALDLTPSGTTRTWARLGAGISTIDWSLNETVENDAYYDSEGLSDPAVTGIQPVFSCSGNRKYGDAAQDYVAAMEFLTGTARETNFRRVSSDGTTVTGACVIANIVAGGGDANSKDTFSFEIQVKGRPTVTQGNKEEFPTTITAAEISVTVGNTAIAGATVAPETASDSLVYAVDDDSIATVDAAGTITGVKAGSTQLTIKSAVLPSVSTTVTVSVSES